MAEFSMDKMARSIAERAMEELKENGVFVGVWIPVSAGSPKESGEYLVSVIDEYDENYEAVGVARYDVEESEWQGLGVDRTVIAWMPKPASFKEGESK